MSASERVRGTCHPFQTRRQPILSHPSSRRQGTTPPIRKQKKEAAERPFRRLQTTPQPGVAYLNSNLADAEAPSFTSISCSIGLPLFSAGCQATNLYLPAGTSLISNFPSSPTTA